MSLMLLLQVVAITVGFGSAAMVYVELGAQMPPATLCAYLVVEGLFLAWWVISIVWLRLRGYADDTPDGWYPHNLQVFWFGNIATVVSLWIAMPYASPEIRLVTAMLCVSPCVFEAIGTVRTPSYGRRGRWGTAAPLAIPVGVVGWFLLSGDRYGYAVALFYVAFSGALLLLREFIQNAVDAVYAAQLDAERMRDERTRFLAAASHDLAQPLQAARLSFDQAERAVGAVARERAIGRVRWAFDSMEQQLRQILDHLRLDAGQVKAAIGDVALAGPIARVAEMHEPAARIATVSLEAVTSALSVRGDPALIERVLSNFVVNALRHAQARRILIGARRSGTKVRLWVIDDGRGVAEADRQRLFDEYAQGGWREREIRGGFGLGLASARRMAELLGGRVGHDAGWRRGSAFWLELPRA